jgi:YidC/Oxa1 family membrane protein insertase
MWNTILIQPITNLMLWIQSIMPGNDLGLAIIVFTLITRLAMWPLIKKQIHSTRVMQKLAPELQKIRAKAKGSKDPQVLRSVNMESMALMQKHKISPFGSIGLLLVQIPLFLAVFSGVKTAYSNSDVIAQKAYGIVEKTSYINSVVSGSTKPVTDFVNWANLSEKPFPKDGEVYVPVLIIALVSIVLQYLQIKQTMPSKASSKKDSDNADLNPMNNKSTMFIMVGLFGLISLTVAGAIGLYIAAGALIAILQQAFAKKHEENEEAKLPKTSVKVYKEGSKKVNEIIEAEIISEPKNIKSSSNKKKKKRR